ncbi:MAG: hypothetical protein DI536_00260 [Archangium gephyra]|uniref:Uncharacterized protein n=1 Tax=Archangium gephyra TaxID=48 RepID=A0A2W5VRP3_9BACT|nr:MAG: hypothetical protein DI536_00260 [Archangium gephyra]
MKTLALIFSLFALPSFADVITEDVANCRGRSAGAACTTPEGGAGTCVEVSVTRPDYSSGVPPTYRQVKMLSCQATGKATSKVTTAWLGLGMAFIALIFALRSRRAPQPA